MLLPGTCCHWECNFGRVLGSLQCTFFVVCISYDGFDSSEQSEFTSMIDETEKIEKHIKKAYGGRIHAAYGCSLGGSFVGLLAARRNIHMNYGILGSSDLDQSGKLSAQLTATLIAAILYPLFRNGRFKSRFIQKRMDKKLKENGEYGKAMNRVIGLNTTHSSHLTKKNVKNQFYSDLITRMPEKISPPDTEIHIFYALKMGEKYRSRYEKHFAHPIIHEQDLRHEEFFLLHPEQWVSLINEICLGRTNSADIKEECRQSIKENLKR